MEGKNCTKNQRRHEFLKKDLPTSLCWLQVKVAARYAGVSERTFENWLREGLKFVKLPTGLRLTRATWIDEFLENFLVGMEGQDHKNQVDHVVSEIFRDIGIN